MRVNLTKFGLIGLAGLCMAGMAFGQSYSKFGEPLAYLPEDDAVVEDGIAGEGGGVCNQADNFCQNVGRGGNAADFAFRTADDFRTTTGGNLVSLCCWGLYFASSNNIPFDDFFTVRIYADDGANGSDGVPGTQLFELAQGIDITLNTRTDTGFDSGTLDVYEYTFTVTTPVALSANTCYWIEFNNFGSTQWAWSLKRFGSGNAFPAPEPQTGDTQGNSRKAQDVNRNGVWDRADAQVRDMAFCLGMEMGDALSCVSAPVPTNTTCATAMPITCGQSVTVTSMYGDLINPVQEDPSLNDCSVVGIFAPPANPGFNPLWFSFTATSTSAQIDTCGSPERLDTICGAYSGTCGNLTRLTCSDDACGVVLQQSILTLRGLTIGQTYLIQVAGKASTNLGDVTVTVTCPAPPQPGNDDCANATALTIGAAPTPGTTEGAARDTSIPFGSVCGLSAGLYGPGVWYSVVGDGNTLTATMCSGDIAVDTTVAVFCGGCSNLTCVAGDDDACAGGGPSQVSWCSQAGRTYLLYVSGFLESTGTHEIAVTTDGTSCTPTVVCPAEDPCAGYLLGDSDGSGAVNNFDIDAFVLAISDPDTYTATFCGGNANCTVCRNDLDHSNAVNNFDIDAFVACLNNLPPSGQPCP